MPFRNSVTIVASPRPRVGKTLLARLLVDFHLSEGREVAAFDLDTGEDSLAQFLPAQAAPASLADIKGQMALFDRLIAEDGVTKIVDVGRDSFAAFFGIAGKIGFAEEAHRRSIAPAVVYLRTPDATSVKAYEDLRGRFARMALTPVFNEMFSPPARRGNSANPDGSGPSLRLPVLAPGLRRYIETPPFSFVAPPLADQARIPPDARIELQRWLRRIFIEFREFDLRILLADLQSSLRQSS